MHAHTRAPPTSNDKNGKRAARPPPPSKRHQTGYGEQTTDMATRVKMANGDVLDIKGIIGAHGKDACRVPMRVYTVSCDDIVFRMCVGANEPGSGSSTIRVTDDADDEADTSLSRSSSSSY
nr:hypothetical protein [Pandoravirus massiliensis]